MPLSACRISTRCIYLLGISREDVEASRRRRRRAHPGAAGADQSALQWLVGAAESRAPCLCAERSTAWHSESNQPAGARARTECPGRRRTPAHRQRWSGNSPNPLSLSASCVASVSMPGLCPTSIARAGLVGQPCEPARAARLRGAVVGLVGHHPTRGRLELRSDQVSSFHRPQGAGHAATTRGGDSRSRPPMRPTAGACSAPSLPARRPLRDRVTASGSRGLCMPHQHQRLRHARAPFCPAAPMQTSRE